MSEVSFFKAKKVNNKTSTKYVAEKKEVAKKSSQQISTFSKSKIIKNSKHAKGDDNKRDNKANCWSKKWTIYVAEHVKCITHEDIDQSGIVTAFCPILWCFFFVLYTLNTLLYFQATFNMFSLDDFANNLLPSDKIVPNNQDKLSSGEQKPSFDEKAKPMPAWIIFVLVVVILILLALLTFGILLLYKKNCHCFIFSLFFVAFLFYLGVFPVIWMQEFVYHYNLPTDWFIFTFTLYNYLGLGMIILFIDGPRLLKKLYNILTCVIVVFFLIKWCTIWVEIALLLAVVLWDLFAVLHKDGNICFLSYSSNHILLTTKDLSIS